MLRAPDDGAWQEFWRQKRPDVSARPNQELVEVVWRLLRDGSGRVLEVGAGRGVDSRALAARGASVVALDYGSEAIEMLRRVIANDTLFVLRADAASLPFADNSFDVVFHQGFLEHFPDPLPLLQEHIRVLRPGGSLVIDVPQKFTYYHIRKKLLMVLGRWPVWERSYSRGELRRLAAALGMPVVLVYPRGYYPRLLSYVRNLRKLVERGYVRSRWLKRLLWCYERAWQTSGVDTLICQDLGIVIQKLLDQQPRNTTRSRSW